VTSDPDPEAQPGTITITAGTRKTPAATRARSAARRATSTAAASSCRRASVVTARSMPCVAAHEVGHGLFGFGHIELRNVEGMTTATMVPGGCEVGRLTTPETDAIQASYARGMRAGATRAEFAQAGLVP
jgi:hypothetical protein